MSSSIRESVRSTIVLGALLAMVGCTTVHPLAVNSRQLPQQLQRGDRVTITTASGQHLNFKVDSVDENGVRGGGQVVAFNDISAISRTETSMGRTALLVLGIVAVGAAAAGGGGGGGGSGY
jgi:hypothetical protein